MSEATEFQPRIDLPLIAQKVNQLQEEIDKVLIGQKQMTKLIISALIAQGHVLIEGVPGTAKTLMVKLLAKTSQTDFSRIQFTPDLMPSDVIGTTVFNPKTTTFTFKNGPVFANLVLIDEINRAPAKTQSALFEVMEEKQITVDGTTHKLEPPFIVIGTQNPIEHEGTYQLPEAQMDRFLFKIDVTHPSQEEEVAILERFNNQNLQQCIESVKTVINKQELTQLQEAATNVRVEKKILSYIAAIIHETRKDPAVYISASTRGSLAVLNGAKAWAAINGKDFVTPDDIKTIVPHALSHRIVLTAEKEMEGMKVSALLTRILNKIEVPR